MIDGLFVTKRFNTYADTFLMLGLARLAEYALSQTKQKAQMQLVDEGSRYRIQFKKPINLEAIALLPYTDPFPPVCGKKTDSSKLPALTTPFNTVEKTEARRLFREYQFQHRHQASWSEDAPPPPDPKTQNGVVLTSMRHDRNHNELWLQGWELRENYGLLIASLLEAFSQENFSKLNGDIKRVTDLFEKSAKCKLPQQFSAVKIFLPTAVQGVSRVKADGNKTDPQKIDWLTLWLIANGLFTFGISERVKVAERVYDWRVTALEPKDISFEKYKVVLDDLRKFNPPSGGHGIARFDAELVLRFCQGLLKSHEAHAKERPEDDSELWQPTNWFVRGFIGTHFGQKGQVYGVKEIFTLGLPIWVHPQNYSQIQDYQNLLKEHLGAITSLAAEEHVELLASYRGFLTGNELQSFFNFQVKYAEYITRSLADKNAKSPRLFSVEGLNMTIDKFKHRQDDKEWSLTEITEDPGFLRIAKAINSATVYAGKIITKNGQIDLDWERQYGLAQRLNSQSGSKKDFVIELTAFIASYENENLRIAEKIQKSGKVPRIWTTKDDIDRLIRLIDKFGSNLVANLLIAYGYAKWGKSKTSEEPPDDISGGISEEELSIATESETGESDDE